MVLCIFEMPKTEQKLTPGTKLGPFPPTALRHRHAKTIGDSSFSYKIDYLIVIRTFLNPERHQNSISGSKVMAILLKGLIFPNRGVASGRVCACSLQSRLVLVCTVNVLVKTFLGATMTIAHILARAVVKQNRKDPK